MAIVTNGLLIYLNYKSGLAGGTTGSKWTNIAPGATAGQYDGTVASPVTVQSDGVQFATGQVTIPAPFMELNSSDSTLRMAPTFEFWTCLDAGVNTTKYAFQLNKTGTPNFFYLRSYSTTKTLQWSAENNAAGVANVLSSTTPIHVLIRRGSAASILDWDIWVNGVQKGSVNKSHTVDGDGTFVLGGDATNGQWAGKINAFRMYNRKLTDAEIAQNYAVGQELGISVPNPPTDSGLITLQGDSSLTAQAIVTSSPIILNSTTSLTVQGNIVKNAQGTFNGTSSMAAAINRNVSLVTNGLKMYYHAKRNQTLDKWGNIAPETVGKYDLTLTGNAADRQPDNLYFNGVDSEARYSDQKPPFITANGFTVDMWFKPDDLTKQALILYGVNSLTSTEYVSFKTNRDGQINFVVKGGTKSLVSNWYTGGYIQLVFRYDAVAQTAELISNGNNILATATSITYTDNVSYPNDSLWLGGTTVGNDHFKGNIRSVRAYDRTLTYAELLQLYDLDSTIGINQSTVKEAAPFQLTGAVTVGATGQGGRVINVVSVNVNLAGSAELQVVPKTEQGGASTLSATSTLSVNANTTTTGVASASLSATSDMPNLKGQTDYLPKISLSGDSSLSASTTFSTPNEFNATMTGESTIRVNANGVLNISATLQGISLITIYLKRSSGVIKLEGELEERIYLMGEW